MLLAELLEALQRIGRQGALGMAAQEFVERLVQLGAALGGTQFRFERIERLEIEDAPRIEAVRIASPLLDARH